MADPGKARPESYDEFTDLVRRVQAQMEVTERRLVTSIALIVPPDGSRRLEIRVVAAASPAARAAIERQARKAIADSFYDGIDVVTPYTPSPPDEYTPASAAEEFERAASIAGAPPTPVHAGMRVATHANCTNAGTAGWFFVINGEVVALSNLHVLCRNGNGSVPGEPLFVNCGTSVNPNATLHHFVPLDINLPNQMDFALARVLDPTLVRGGMHTCTHPAPVDLHRGQLTPGSTDLFRADGQASSCQSGRKFIGTINVQLFGDFWMVDQLIFEKLARNGDSGAVVVHEGTNTVVGLFFMFDTNKSIACPIGRILSPAWTKVGERNTGAGMIPMFSGVLP